MMNVFWIVIATAVVAGLVKWLTSRAGDRIDPGFVSHQWVNEHRLSQTGDSPR
jgi:hypothetical protein